MARIQLGPFASRISGSVGEVEFRWTRDGQVAQTKTISGTWSTPAAMLTKNRFARAMHIYSHLDDVLRLPLAQAARDAHKAASQSWVSATYKLLQGKPWYYPDTHRSTFRIELIHYSYSANWLYITLGPTVDPYTHRAYWGLIPETPSDRIFDWSWSFGITGTEWQVFCPADSRPATAVFFPIPLTDPSAVGHSISLHIPAL